MQIENLGIVDHHLRMKSPSMGPGERKKQIFDLQLKLLDAVRTESLELQMSSQAGIIIKKNFYDLQRYKGQLQTCEFLAGKKGNFIILNKASIYKLEKYSAIYGILASLTKNLRGDEMAVSYSPLKQSTNTGLPDQYWSQWRNAEYDMHQIYEQIDSNILNIVDKLFSFLHNQPPAILELFGGVGNLAESILKKHSVYYTLVDCNLPSITKAKEKLKSACEAKTCRLYQEDVVNASFESFLKGKKQDIVIIEGGLTSQVLNNKMEAMRVVKKAYAVMNDHGFMILAGLGRHWVDVEALSPLFKILNSYDPQRDRECYVLQKRADRPNIKMHDGVLDLFLAFHQFKLEPNPIKSILALLASENIPLLDVTTLDLSETAFTTSQLQELLLHFPRLKHIKFCNGIADIAELLNKLPLLPLETLDLSHTAITSKEVYAIIKKFNLKDVILDYCRAISHEEQALIRARLALKQRPHKPDLFFLCYRHYRETEIFSKVFHALIGEGLLTKGVAIKLGNVALDDSTAFQIIEHVGVENLELKFLSEASLSDPFKLALQRLKGWTNVKGGIIYEPQEDCINFSISKKYTDKPVNAGQALRWLIKMAPPDYLAKIREIGLARATLSLSDLHCLTAFPNLKKLNLHACVFLDVPMLLSPIKLDLSCFHDLKLTSLNLYGSQIDGHSPLLSHLFVPGTPLFESLESLQISISCHNLANFCKLPEGLKLIDPRYVDLDVTGGIWGSLDRNDIPDDDEDSSED